MNLNKQECCGIFFVFGLGGFVSLTGLTIRNSLSSTSGAGYYMGQSGTAPSSHKLTVLTISLVLVNYESFSGVSPISMCSVILRISFSATTR